uniref:Uncharacterized protein n=1 Tax=Glossina austeni TaxID=7395 RepID=A0A1A9V5M3_GLOAU
MIMHGTTTWYKGPQLAHHTHHADYHHHHHHHHTQLRSYPSFVLSGSYHDNSSLNVSTGGAGCLTPNGPSATPILVESSYAGINQLSATNIGASQLTILSPTIKVEQNFAEPLSSVEDYALNLESSGGNNNIDGTFKVSHSFRLTIRENEISHNFRIERKIDEKIHSERSVSLLNQEQGNNMGFKCPS